MLRKRPKQNNLIKSSVNKTTVDVLCKLLCKPVSVRLIKLSTSELEIHPESDLPKAQMDNVSLQKKSSKSRKRKTKKFYTYRKLHKNKDNDEIVPQSVPLHRKKINYENNEQSVQNLSKDVKQPYVRLHRIDEVINKIAQSLGKVTQSKDYETTVQTECVKETEINDLVIEPTELVPLDTDKDDYLQNPNNESTMSNSFINKIRQSIECTESNKSDFSDDDVIYKYNINKRFRKKRKIMLSSSDDSSNSSDTTNNDIQNKILKAAKKVKLNLPENSIEINKIITEENKVVETTCINENPVLQMESSKELNISDKLHDPQNGSTNSNTDENVDVLQQRLSITENTSDKCDHDDDKNLNVTNAIEENSSVPSELNVGYITNDNALKKIKNNSVRVEKPIVKSQVIQEPIKESSTFHKDFAQKYKLFKELRVLLIKFDSMKVNNKYSATEVERLLDSYHPQQRSTVFNCVKSKVQNDNEKSTDETLSNSVQLLDSNIRSKECANLDCETPGKTVNATIIEAQYSTVPSSSSNKSSQESNKNIRQNRNLDSRKACIDLASRFENCSQESSKYSASDNSEHTLIILRFNSESTSLSSPTKPINETPELSLKLPEQLNSTSQVESSMIKSTSYTSSIQNKVSKTVAPEESSTELITEDRTSKKTKDISKSINLRMFLPNENEKFLALETMAFISKTPKKSVTIMHPRSATKKSSPTYYSSIVTPIKSKKIVDKKDTRISIYKCIVCDLCFDGYSDLQQHLIVHTNKQSNTMSNLLIEENALLVESQTVTDSSKSDSPEISDGKSTEQGSLNNQQRKKDTSPKSLPKKRRKKICNFNKSNDCTVCSKAFQTQADLAAHIFLHTESELQQALKLAKEKEHNNLSVQAEEEKTEEISSNDMETVVEHENSTMDDMINQQECGSGRIIECSASDDIETVSSSKSEKEKLNKVENSRRSFTICECHSTPGTKDNCLQIEIVLLCHTCRTLFRSMACFETHYRLPKYIVCKKNRLTSGRSPNLFCTACGMIFSLIEDVRQHLETHARFKETCTTDFRCNICKIIFLGIGTLFYMHWSKHVKHPFWMASEHSFPAYSVIKSKQNVMISNVPAEDYISIAEYVCVFCKTAFIIEDDLRKHIQKCEVFNEAENNDAAQKQQEIRITCSLCNDTFTEKTEFYKHVRDKHKFSIDPQFTTKTLTPTKTVYNCNVCMGITRNFDDFEDHWLKHSMIHMFFTCTQCKVGYPDSLNSFLVHAMKHKNDALSCIVNYTKTKHVCNGCCLGFDTLQSLGEHIIIIHKRNDEGENSKNNLTTNQVSPTAVPNTNNTLACVELKNLAGEKQPEASSWMELQTTAATKETSGITSNTINDKEELIRILEGNEDDSENELVIDLMNELQERSSSSTVEGNKEKETASNVASDTSSINQTCVISNTLPRDASPSLNAESPIVSKISSLTLETPTNDPQSSHASLNNVNNYNDSLTTEKMAENEISKQTITNNLESVPNNDTVSTLNQEEATNVNDNALPPKKQSPSKPKWGLRVKTLAELTGSVQLCKCCGSSVVSADDLAEHVTKHNLSSTDGEERKIVEKQMSTQQHTEFTLNPRRTNKPSLEVKLLQSSQNLNIPMLMSTGGMHQRLLLPKQQIAQSSKKVINNQQPERIKTHIVNVYQTGQPPTSQNVKSAYHKNLPACNIIRKTIRIPRSAGTSCKRPPNVVNLQAAQKSVSTTNENKQLFSSTRTINNSEIRYTCKLCGFRTTSIVESSKHQVLGTEFTCKKLHARLTNQGNRTVKATNLPTVNNMNQTNPNCKQYQQAIVYQSGANPIYYQYPYLNTSSTSNNTQMLKQNQRLISNQPVTGNSSPSFCYKSSGLSNGGMSIVINQTTPTVQNVPTIGIVQQTPQQQIYPPQVYSDSMNVMDASYMQQSQNLIDFSGSNAVYPVTSEHCDVLNGEATVTTYEFSHPTFVCDYCPKTFTSEDLLQMHINSDHTFIYNI
ncbi:unnamed protein product [Xylocopa violacea]